MPLKLNSNGIFLVKFSVLWEVVKQNIPDPINDVADSGEKLNPDRWPANASDPANSKNNPNTKKAILVICFCRSTRLTVLAATVAVVGLGDDGAGLILALMIFFFTYIYFMFF